MIYCIKLFTTLYYSGARTGELLALTWADIDFEENRLILIKPTITDKLQNPKPKHQIALLCYRLLS